MGDLELDPRDAYDRFCKAMQDGVCERRYSSCLGTEDWFVTAVNELALMI